MLLVEKNKSKDNKFLNIFHNCRGGRLDWSTIKVMSIVVLMKVMLHKSQPDNSTSLWNLLCFSIFEQKKLHAKKANTVIYLPNPTQIPPTSNLQPINWHGNGNIFKPLITNWAVMLFKEHAHPIKNQTMPFVTNHA